MLENINQEQFEQIINLLIMYKQLNKDKVVYLNETSLKKCMSFFKNVKLPDPELK